MKIQCIDNTGKNLSKNLHSLEGYSETREFIKLTPDNIYIVYAIFTMKGEKWYLICDDWYNGENLNFPEFYPASLFKIVDGTPSKYWISAHQKDDYSDSEDLVLNTGFPNIVNEEYFLGNLVEGYEREILLFKKYKEFIDKDICSG